MKKKSTVYDIRKVMVKRSPTGLGLFAAAPFLCGACVIEYVGEKITTAEGDRRGGRYLFEVNSRTMIDGTRRTNIARYANHSCKPNCTVEIKRGKVFLFTKRAVKEGEELTYNYGKEYFDEFLKPKGCLCSSCRNERIHGNRSVKRKTRITG